ncbi:ABC transporter permease [Streptococcus pyogenes]
MISYLKADLFRIRQERLALFSCMLLVVIAVGVAYSFRKTPNQVIMIQIINIITDFVTLFFLTPARIFFSDDYNYRTINNVVVKQQYSTFIIFSYLLVTFCFSLLFISLTYLLSALAFHLFTGQAYYGIVIDRMIKQLPFYIAIIALCQFLFNILRKTYQSITAYILYVLLFDKVSATLANHFFKLDISPVLMFKHLSLSLGDKHLSSTSILVAFGLTLCYLLGNVFLFSKRELK